MALADFSPNFVADLVSRARGSARRRQHFNIHAEYADPVQRLFNGIEPDSYIRPHRHLSDPKRECLIGVRGAFALIAFDAEGGIERIVHFGAAPDLSIGVELDHGQWHTVIAKAPGSVLFEVKQGPFDPLAAKNLAPWAPEEGSGAAVAYLEWLHRAATRRGLDHSGTRSEKSLNSD
ncbi:MULTISPECIES: WbuC family cupin fold metalloprotein [unclassified Sphingomonas]|uniref:WbuC family cupin fold metalloprotein n=1 Tax=unclassified Sphingomonas TaxID=196159 RepID=UPI0021517CA1|nr:MULTISPECIES: WbuC family cupin fold metalloprotein [unclassified Sphingomonas]MCR5871134.1 WbuC family cupin fold metalloprotein [Sphingomonas sp. J344]UUY00554.1 WbuC family cupin fold metalloprotein [Sphingomonas sp. J315]